MKKMMVGWMKMRFWTSPQAHPCWPISILYHLWMEPHNVQSTISTTHPITHSLLLFHFIPIPVPKMLHFTLVAIPAINNYWLMRYLRCIAYLTSNQCYWIIYNAQVAAVRCVAWILVVIISCQIWTKVSLQSKSYHHPHLILPPQTINAGHPLSPSVLGCYDRVIMNVNPTKDWPLSRLNGSYFFSSSYIGFALFFRACCHQFMTQFSHHSNLSTGCIQKTISHLHPAFWYSPSHKCSCVKVWDG